MPGILSKTTNCNKVRDYWAQGHDIKVKKERNVLIELMPMKSAKLAMMFAMNLKASIVHHNCT